MKMLRKEVKMEIKKFKEWLVRNNLDENELFLQSIKCYQSEAYKAAYLYSYLGYMDYIKNTIVNYARVPKVIVESNLEKTETEIDRDWKRRLLKLDSEDMWESATMDFIKQSSEKNIFRLKDVIREEFISKKDLRNVCAHNKTRTISGTTVEDLWDFINYSMPYIVVNGSTELWQEHFIQIIKFADKDKYEVEIHALYDEYCKWNDSDRRCIFEWILESAERAIDRKEYNLLECSNIFFEKVFEEYHAQEYRWIKYERTQVYFLLNIGNYRKPIDKMQIQQYVYSHKDDVITQMICLGQDEKINEFLERIYTPRNFDEWWDLISSLECSIHTFRISDNIMEIIADYEKLDSIFERLQQNLYKYKTSYGNGKTFDTDTFDYCSFGEYCGDVKVLLFMIMSGKLNGEEAEELVERSKKILDKDYSDPDVNRNYSQMYTFLQRDKQLFDWLNSQEIED